MGTFIYIFSFNDTRDNQVKFFFLIFQKVRHSRFETNLLPIHFLNTVNLYHNFKINFECA